MSFASDSDEKSRFLAREYVARIERESSFVLDEDLRRIVTNTYSTAYLRGSSDAIEACIAGFGPQVDVLIARVAALESELESRRGEVS